MPFQSEAQRRKFYAMADRGEISRKTVADYEKKTRGALPERLTKHEAAKKREEAKQKAINYKKQVGK